jgi:hypothetical protein
VFGAEIATARPDRYLASITRPVKCEADVATVAFTFNSHVCSFLDGRLVIDSVYTNCAKKLMITRLVKEFKQVSGGSRAAISSVRVQTSHQISVRASVCARFNVTASVLTLCIRWQQIRRQDSNEVGALHCIRHIRGYGATDTVSG